MNESMQNNISDEEPSLYFQRVYGVNKLIGSKLETCYCELLDCGSSISMDEFMNICNKLKK